VSTFEALADPVRQAIVERLAEGDVGAGVIAAAFPVSRPAVSRHLRVLRDAGIVTSRVAGQERIYALDRRPLAALDAWLERFRPLPGTDLPGTDLPGTDLPGTDPPRAPEGPAGRLGALDTEMARGRRRASTEERGGGRGRSTG